MSKDKQIHIRVTEDEKKKMEENAREAGFRQLSEYLRFLGLSKPLGGSVHTKVIDGQDVIDQMSISLEFDQCPGTEVDWDDQSLGERR